ncbi:phenylacetate--CoA ligase family protein [Taklimakanibacter deserti]|uniref:phenylacetate--CoA ligase family protein n=1 Tax=Taklimakanibacter deserti TaxID=2267839 RepID=UPI000E64D507
MAGLDIAEAYLESLLRSERMTRQELSAYQAKLLRALVKPASGETPYYSDRAAPPDDLAPDSPYWLAQPFVTRKDLVENFDAFRPRSFARLHGTITPLSTGGSTGPAARRDVSSLESVARLLASYRMYHNWKLDQSRPLFVLRKTRREEQMRQERWGFPWRDEKSCGKRTWIDIATPPREQLQAMAGEGPVYVNTLPSNILRLSLEAIRADIRLSLPYIISVGEYLAPEVRTAAARAFGSTIIDSFASAEAGIIAIQCPETGLYHIQSEQVLAEIVSPQGRLCAVGETGEVVVTPLYGYATPLLRYRSGDYAEAGPPCPCGRILPTISRIAGRLEHMFDLPGEATRLPKIDRVLITGALEHDQWVLAQSSETEVTFRHVGALSVSGKEKVRENLDQALGNRVRCTFSEVAELPLTSGGKRHFTTNEMSARSS